MKFQDIKVDWSGFSEKKRSKVLFAFYANPTYIQQPTSPPHPTLDHVEHKKLGKICSLLSIVIFQFFEIFNFEYNVLLWKDFGIWNILLKIDFKKNFNFIQSSKGSACCVLLLFTTSWDVLFPAWHDTSMYFEQIATTIKTCAISISKFETSKFAELDTIKRYNYILH